MGSTDPNREEEEEEEGGGREGRSLAVDGASEVELSFDEDNFLLFCFALEEELAKSMASDVEDCRFRLGTSLRERRSFCA